MNPVCGMIQAKVRGTFYFSCVRRLFSMTIPYPILLGIILMTLPVILNSQLHCLNFTSQDGLPADNSLCAIEDRDGFMWFGTASGVCKFDGSTFVNYSIKGTGELPGGAYVMAIVCDVDNNIWIGTEKRGIFHLDRSKQLWTNYSSNRAAKLKIPGDEISFLHSNGDGKIWYGCNNGGLGCIDHRKEKNVNYLLNDLPRAGGWKNIIRDLLVNRTDSSLFYVIGQGYLMEFNTKTKNFSIPEIKKNPKLVNGLPFSPQTLTYGPGQEIWLGTWGSGVKSYNLKTQFYSDVLSNSNSAQFAWRSNVYAGNENEVWVAEYQEGISKYDLSKNQFTSFKTEPYNRNSLMLGTYNSIFQASSGELWVLTAKGVSLVVPAYQAFQYYENEVEKTNFFLDIKPIQNQKKYIAAYAGENGPLKILDKDFNIISRHFIIPDKDVFQSVFKIQPYKNKFICMANRLYEYDPIYDKVSLLNLPGYKQKGAMNDILIDESSNLWMLVGNGSVVKYQMNNHRVNEYFFKGYENVGREKIIYNELAFVGDKVWISAATELIVLDPKTEKSRYFYSDGQNFHERESTEKVTERTGTIQQVMPKMNQQAWVSTSGEGIYLLEYSEENGIQILERRNSKNLDQLQSPVEMIRGGNNDYWIATRNGLVHTDVELSAYKVIAQREGLRSSKLSQGLSRIGDQIFVGMPKGFVHVNSKKLLTDAPEANCFITSAQMNNIDISTTEASFGYKENNFVVTASTPNYHESKSVTYAHRLLNQSEEWQFSDYNENTFRYEQLNPGKYIFEVKAKSSSQEWSAVVQKKFVVKPPFWKTTWFRLLALCTFGVLGYLIYQLKLKKDLKEEKVKTQMAELENQALRAQMNPHFIFNSLNSIKSLILLDRKQEGITYLTKFSKMVREILNLSKQSVIPLEKELELLRIYLDMESLRFHQKFEYNIHIDPSVNLYQQKVPPLLIQPFAENSIWHGLLHKEGDAHLNIRIHETQEHLVISIEDNGIGRDASNEIKAKKTIYKKSSEGMKLSKNRIQLVDQLAEINVEDLYEGGLAKGTKVTIKLPVKNDK